MLRPSDWGGAHWGALAVAKICSHPRLTVEQSIFAHKHSPRVVPKQKQPGEDVRWLMQGRVSALRDSNTGKEHAGQNTPIELFFRI